MRVRVVDVGAATLLILLVALPKAGVRMGELPITFGYALLAATSGVCAVKNLLERNFKSLSRIRVLCLMALLPFQIFTAVEVTEFPWFGNGYVIAYLISFFFLPTCFLLFLGPQIDRMSWKNFEKIFKICILFVSIFGIFGFIWKIFHEDFFSIPYVTANGDDGNLGDKDNQRGTIYKLISTYNNGNIYGVSILMLLPLYSLLEKKFSRRFPVHISLILTLSRTVWLGLVLFQIISNVLSEKISLKKLTITTISLGMLLGFISLVLSQLGLELSFLFDSNLGGRAETLRTTPMSIFTESGIGFPSEVIYASIVWAFGIFALPLFIVALIVPVFSLLPSARKSTKVQAIIQGLILFLICGLSDGPMLLIPIMAFYWGLVTLGAKVTSHDDEPSGAINSNLILQKELMRSRRLR